MRFLILCRVHCVLGACGRSSAPPRCSRSSAGHEAPGLAPSSAVPVQEHLTELRQHLGGEDLFKAVDSKACARSRREGSGDCRRVRAAKTLEYRSLVAAPTVLVARQLCSSATKRGYGSLTAGLKRSGLGASPGRPSTGGEGPAAPEGPGPGGRIVLVCTVVYVPSLSGFLGASLYVRGRDMGRIYLHGVAAQRVKAAITREFNSGSHAMRVVVPKGKKRRAAADPDDPDGPDADEDAGPPPADGDEDSGDDAAASGLIKVKGKAKAKAKGKAKAKASAGGAADEAAGAAAPKAKGRAKAKARR
ncbi:unnamed protein product [Prorocentrum cordatum]|uniref:Uncharacterized protein n=1 Tax=Prorocentrum cordatum TaxID=2364126 RepID=A0ABN9QZM8_9DINO|nr:unnamed protein product [Polarella glacialis]